jgi:hypothetical protein
MKIHAGTGSSTALEAAEAGREAAAAAVDALGGETPAVVIVFSTPRYDLPALLSAIRSVTGDVLLVGSTSSGEMVQDKLLGIGAGVGVLALTAGPYRFGAASVEHIQNDLDRAGQTIARTSRAEAGPSPHAALLLIADGMLGDLQQFVNGVYRITGPKVPLVGGAAGDDQRFLRPYVFHNDQVIEDGAVALWIASPHPLHVCTRHGWEPIGIPMLVTRARGIEIIEIGGSPAAEAYEEQLGLAPGELLPEKFWDTSIYHPFGLLQADGTTVIRVARSKDEQGVLKIQGCVPPTGSAVQVMSGNADTLLGVVDGVARDSLEGLTEAGVLLAFSCAARAKIFGKRAGEETARLQSLAGSTPVFGVYCCGEFARTAGVLSTHNATLTAIAL